MKLGVNITAFREKRLIKPVIRQFEGIADRIVVAVSSKPWQGTLRADSTAKLARQTSAIVKEDYWENEANQRNWVQDQLRDMDYVVVAHADTFFTHHDLLTLKSLNLTKLHYTCRTLTYWKDFETVIDPDISLPTIIVRSNAEFMKMVNIDNQEVEPEELPITCHHLSWVKTDKEIIDKTISYSHANEIPFDWIKNVWQNNKVVTNLSPTNPSDYQRLRKHSLPLEIRNKL